MADPIVVPVFPAASVSTAVPAPGVTPFIQLLGQTGAGSCEGDSCGI